MTDLHQHVLWGLDDGPRTRKAMYRMLNRAAADGVGLIAATPHAYPARRRFDIDLYRQRLSEANAYCARRALPLRVVEGCEIHYCDAIADLLRAGKLPTLGGSQYVLVEFNDRADFKQIEEAADRLFNAGYQPIIAHVERIRCMIRSPQVAMRLKDECGFLFQVDCGAILHPRGWFQRRFLKRLLQARAIDLVATDAHDAVYRPTCMRETYKRLKANVGSRYAAKLVRCGWQLLNCKDTDK